MGMIGKAGVEIGKNKRSIFGKMSNKRECIEYASNRGLEVPKSKRVKAVL